MLRKLLAAVLLAFTLPSAASADTKTFTDVAPTFWAADEIHELAELGALNGYPNGRFYPNNLLTRAQSAKVLHELTNPQQAPSDFRTQFTDATSNHWAYGYIRDLTHSGVFRNAELFRPEENLSRAQMAKIIVESFDIITDDNDLSFFVDTPAGEFHTYITTIAELGITTGRANSRFDPNGPVTRAQFAAFSSRALEFDRKRDAGEIVYDKESEQYIDLTDASPNPPSPQEEISQQTIVLVNAEREARGIAPLTADPALSAMAQLKSEDMAQNNYFEHESPTYGQVWDMAAMFDYSFTRIGENIAWNQQSAREVVTAWMNSEGHRANILDPRFTHIGAGFAKNAEGELYWTHHFSRK
ncbi:Parasporal protein [Bhargavaea cecembensis DSE10]|uniref:Parasporal protein n=1 Tax=Bhargavaea cecembensis DSE10 TaxID=1235279 RepID=M7NH98_9BACL|nr:S-layer homology domain-containing protein [Bhargavaea cecembensis]EMR07923.1 Parasporal protein [Bhargavaea cecembensis DSE10]